MLRALDRETYRRLSVNYLDACPRSSSHRQHARASNSGNICEVRDLATRRVSLW
jgi:hypothetical protein